MGGIDDDMNKVLEGLRGAGVEVGNAINSAEVLAGIAELATKCADRMKRDAAPESPQAILRAVRNIQTVTTHARKARFALSQGDSQIAAMFDGSLEGVQTQLADVQSSFQTTVGNTVHVMTKQSLADTLREVAASARSAANTLGSILQQVSGGVGVKEKAVDDVISGRY